MVPLGPVNVRVYVVVVVGETLTDPEVETLPTSLSMDALVALVLLHDNVVLAPRTIAVGLTEKLPVGAGIVTVALAVLVPASPLMVRV